MIPDDLQAILARHFGHSSLRPAQEQALDPILAGRDAVIVMPTGAGKSLCYQLPALHDERGLTIVVSPLISLMKDQVDALRARGIEAATINSSVTAEESRETYEAINAGSLRLLYVSPERLGNGSFLNLISGLEISRIAVDEAHCVSQWGHDFRPDYLRISDFLERVGRPQVVALTATATPRVRRDIAASLQLREPAVIVTGFDRPGLSCRVERVKSAVERDRLLVEALRARQGKPGAHLVYVGSRKNADRAAGALRDRGIDCEVYHAGLGAAERSSVQEAFMSGACQTVVATNAFGMGIDRTDVRLVMHYDLPGSLEAYYQEIGRAGRDGEPAEAVLLFSEASVRLQEFFIKRAHPAPALVRLVYSLLQDASNGGLEPDLAALEQQIDDRELAPQLSAAVNRLIALGLVWRGGSGEFHADPNPRASLEDLLDAEGMAARREADEEKLGAVLRYARRRICRRNVILEYFEAEREGATCGRCDVCEGSVAKAEELDEDEILVLRKILSGVARTRGYAGRKKIVGMLVGSQAKGIGDSWLANLSTYGILKYLARDRIEACIMAAIDGGLIDLRGDRYPTLELTDSGIAVLKGEETPALAWPKTGRKRKQKPAPAAAARPKKSKPAPTKSAVAKSEPTEIAQAMTDAGGTVAAAAPEPAPEPELELQPEPEAEPGESELAERIRAWRRERAETDGVPAYVVFGNKTLDSLLEIQPTCLEELEAVHGLGPSRIERYGEDLLGLLEAE